MLVADTTLTFGTPFKRFDPQRFTRRLRAAKAKQRTLRSQAEARPSVFESVPGESASAGWAVPPSMKQVVEVVPDRTGSGREVQSYRVVYNGGPCKKCWHCGYDLPAGEDQPDAWGGYPAVVALDRIQKRFLTKGHFCTPSCALGSLRSGGTVGGGRNAQSLTRFFYHLRYGISMREQIHPAPPKHCLTDYGGHMTIAEYRRSGWVRGNEPLARARDLPRPMTIAHETPRADVVVWGPEGAPRPELWRKRPALNGSSFARHQSYLRYQQEQKEHPTAMGRPTWRGKNGKRNFMSHWSQKDADLKAAKDAADLRAIRDIATARANGPPSAPPAPSAQSAPSAPSAPSIRDFI